VNRRVPQQPIRLLRTIGILPVVCDISQDLSKNNFGSRLQRSYSVDRDQASASTFGRTEEIFSLRLKGNLNNEVAISNEVGHLRNEHFFVEINMRLGKQCSNLRGSLQIGQRTNI
jgi:hypothetical protein